MGVIYANSSSTTTPLFGGAVLSGDVGVPKYLWAYKNNPSNIIGQSITYNGQTRSPNSDGEVWESAVAVPNPAYKEPVGSDGKPITGTLNEASSIYNQYKDLTPEQKANIDAQIKLIDSRTPIANDAYDKFIGDVNAGKFDAKISPVANAALPSEKPKFDNVTAASAGSADQVTAAQTAPYKDYSVAYTPKPSDIAVSTVTQPFEAATAMSKPVNLAPASLAQYKEAQAAQSDYAPFVEAAYNNNVPHVSAAFANLSGEISPRQADYNPVYAAQTGGYQDAQSAYSDLASSRSGLGAIDPTNSLQRLLSGQVDNPYLASMNQANINQAMRGYDDAIQRLNQQVLPQINNDAFAAGQYGGSRQGIAQGLALQQMDRNARDLGIAAMDSGNKLFGDAYQQAQQNMMGTANSLNSLAAQNSQFNAANQQQANLSNAQNRMANTQFDVSNSNQVNLSNADNLLKNSQFNAENFLQADTQNMNNLLQLSQFNAQNRQQAMLANAGYDIQNGQYNASNQQQANLANATNWLQNSQYNASNQQQANLQNANNGMDSSKFNATALNNNNQQNVSNLLQNTQFNTTAKNNMSQFNLSNWLQNQQNNMAAQNNMSQFNAQKGQAYDFFNAGAANTAAQNNAQMNLQNQQFNTAALNNMGQFNADKNQAYDFFNANTFNNTRQFNASNNLQLGQYLYDKGVNNAQFNANLGITNNQQAMANSQLGINNAQDGLTAMANKYGLQDSAYNAKNNLYAAPQQWALDAINSYGALAYGGTPLLGNTTASITPFQEQKKSGGCS